MNDGMNNAMKVTNAISFNSFKKYIYVHSVTYFAYLKINEAELDNEYLSS